MKGVQSHLFRSIADNITNDDNCREIVTTMANAGVVHSVFYAIESVLNFLAALYAIKSNQLFEYQEIQEGHKTVQNNFFSNL